MKTYLPTISLTNNSRGVWSLDTTIGCASGTKENRNGCYGDCYAAKAAKIHGYDFTKTVIRNFENEPHRYKTIEQIARIPLPFVRIGTMGDPSEDWAHTLKICREICTHPQLEIFPVKLKEIVIITKHWQCLTDAQLIELVKYPICINTSVSALDSSEAHLWQSVAEFVRLKPYCKSVLRIVSADFNINTPTGKRLSEIQDELFKHTPTLDTVLRVAPYNKYVKDGVIRIKESKFLGKKQYMSKYNRKTYTGRCGTCKEMCGVTI